MSVEVTEDEADKKARYYREVLARRGQGDRTALMGAKEDKAYRWVSKKRVEERKTQGFSIVEHKDGVQGVASQQNVDNTVGLKDELVLMHEDRELREMKRQQDKEKAESLFKRRMEGHREDLEKKARDMGLADPHKSVVVDRSREGSPSEALVVAKRKLPG